MCLSSASVLIKFINWKHLLSKLKAALDFYVYYLVGFICIVHNHYYLTAVKPYNFVHLAPQHEGRAHEKSIFGKYHIEVIL